MLSLLGTACLILAPHLPRVVPESVGMSAERLRRIDHVMARAIASGGFPGAAVVVGRRGHIVWQRGYGHLDWESGSIPVSAETTIYDLASLTKVVATGAAAMVLYDAGRLSLDAPVSRYLPAFRGGGRERVTVRHLLEHRAGLPAGRELGRAARVPADARRLVLQTPLVAPPGTRYEYSDLGPILLGFVVEAIAGEPLDQFVTRRVYAPLGMHDTRFRPPARLHARAAPTEVHSARGRPLRGEVHDESANALGGVAGHAGLFGTAADLALFAQMLLDGGTLRGVRVASDSAVAQFTRRASGWRALGWDTCGGGGSCGRYLGPRAFGHTGFTGTSLWIDPERELFVIVLTNWVHDGRGHRPTVGVLSDVRADVADLAALAVVDGPAGALAMPAVLRADRAIGWPRASP